MAEPKVAVTGPIPYIDQVIAALGQINIALPLLVLAGKLIWSQFHKSNPEATFADFQEFLLAQATELGTITEEWLTAHGWTKGPDGKWVAPPSPV